VGAVVARIASDDAVEIIGETLDLSERLLATG
jgi:hypothetical protein